MGIGQCTYNVTTQLGSGTVNVHGNETKVCNMKDSYNKNNYCISVCSETENARG